MSDALTQHQEAVARALTVQQRLISDLSTLTLAPWPSRPDHYLR